MAVKKRGCDLERELVKLFWDIGWAAIRVAGSGSSHFPSPDLLVSNGSRVIALECKSTCQQSKHVRKQEIEQLVIFAQRFGAEPWVGLRFNHQKWSFFPIKQIKSLNIKKKDIQSSGVSLENI